MIDVLKSGDPKLGEESVLALNAVKIAQPLISYVLLAQMELLLR